MTTTNIFSICLAVSLFGAGCSKDLENSEPPAVEVNKIGSEFAVGTQNERLLENFSRNPFVHREIPYVAMAGAQSLGSAIRIRPSAVVAVKDHGARPSDGNDDTPAFYSALAKARELVAGGSRVTIQMDSGIYQLSDALFVEGGHTVLRGNGVGNTILEFNTSLQNAVPVGHPLQKTFSWRGGMIWFCPDTTRNLENEKPEALLQNLDLPPGSTRIPMASMDRLFQKGDLVRTIVRGDVEMVREAAGNPTLDIASYKGWNILDDNGHWWHHTLNVVTEVSDHYIELLKPMRFGIMNQRHLYLSRCESELAVGGGAADFTIQFQVKDDGKYVHLSESGYNAFFIHKTAFAVLENIQILNADNAVILEHSHHCTVRNIISERDRKAHHGVSLRNTHDTLVTYWTQRQRVQHGLSMQDYSSGNVFSSCVMDHGTIDCHMGMPFDNVRTEIMIHQVDGSGGGAFGPTAGRRIVTWNVSAIPPISKGKPYLKGLRAFLNPDAFPQSALVGVHGAPVESKPEGGTMLIADWNKIPSEKNLYTFQLRMPSPGK